ncbi:protein WVD2-like 7 isoform X2 [Alnus glutinosa]|uniref:protein WVD2-like 7 isoform X2 n=1 Tax=Alnus glutinosa TaxID=3517 RepID=UPI002D76DC14|nr:protein WVD2-like 7 isoform X2 [Alnus glutinosa]
MGESACLVRSFSHPSDSSTEAKKEGDPIRALGESISFGRFMSESLAWEKWSAFSHNRYLEEVEKFSKPGSVAQKKAYFEAHYKKKAAERAAELIEESNAAAHNVFKSETRDKHHDDSFMDSELVKAEDHKSIDEPHEDDAPNTAVDYSADVNGCNPNIGELETTKVEADEGVNVVEDPTLPENSDQIEKVEDHQKILVVQEEKKLNKKSDSKEILASPSKKRQLDSSLKLSTQGRASKLPVSPAKRMTSKQLQSGNSGAAESKKTAGDLVDKKRFTVKSVHMSINFASPTGKTSKTPSPIIQEVGSARYDTTLFHTSQDSSTPLRMTRASVNKLIKQPSVKPQSEDRRTRTLLNKSVSGRIAGDGKGHSLSMDFSKSSTVSGIKARSPTVSSPFTFRSEERAAKRKEFFQKMEEKLNAKEAEKVQLQSKPKEKAQFAIEKLQQSTDFKAKQNEDSNHGSQSPSSPLKKNPLAQPRSPKHGRKPTPSTVRDSSSRPPRRPSGRNDSSNSKRVTEKVNQTTIRFIASLPKKNAHENASPNIQH